MKALEHTTFPDVAERISALYNEDEDALMLGMLGQEYVIRHQGIFLRGQKAPDAHGAVVLDYLFSSGDRFTMTPWKSFGDLVGRPSSEFRSRVEAPLQQQVSSIIGRAATILPHLDAKIDQSLIGSDMAINVQALPKVYLHIEMSQESSEFPPEVWVQFSHNASEFLSPGGLLGLGELFKERLLSLVRIY